MSVSSPDSSDRNLLFGILALQMDFISREGLIKAMHAWVLEKSKPLGQLLVEQGAISAEHRALLEPLVQKHVEMHGNDPQRSLASVSSIGSARQQLEQIADENLYQSLAHVAALRVVEDDPLATQPPTVGESTSAGQRFRILRPHAEGGLGKVFVAHDEELSREVALKEIKDRFADEPDKRSRFLLEAEITGGLEHPGIVPVYGLGRYADGRPFYAMRFIRGDSLQDAIARFHRADAPNRDPGERTLALRKLLGRFLDVCNAIAYAHSRGVLHRDLKPGNIMLGKFGETLVVDWGLAKPLGRAEKATDSMEGPLQPSSASGSNPTQMGSAIGTPSYMPPEQAAGRLDQLGPASDVYSLGATLYCLLTGVAPFEGMDVGAVLWQVENGEFRPPRQVKSTVPEALEAVCLKAMARKPEDRYASPRALAEEIEHWLADEPVSAWCEPLPARLGRWVRKHKILASWSAAVVAIVATAVVAALLVTAAQAREQQEQLLRQEAEAERARAEHNQADADEQRERAEQNRREADRQRGRAERYLYASHMDVAYRQWQESKVVRVLELLEEHRPKRPGEEDLRGFEWHYLWRLCHSDVLTCRGHTDAILSVAYSPDGKRLASGGVDQTVRVWDAATGQETLTLKGHTDRVMSLAFSPDGKRVASGGWDQTVRVWDAATGRETLTLKGHSQKIARVAFSPDGKRLASGGFGEGTVKIWDAETGQEALILRGHTNQVRALTFSPDCKIIASSGADEVKLWSALTGEQTLTLKGSSGMVFSLAFSPDGKRLVTGDYYGTMKVWDTTTGRWTFSHQEGGIGPVYSLAFSPDGKRLASAGDAGIVSVWDPITGDVALTLRGHTAQIQAVAFSPDGKRLASGSYDKTVRVWDAATGQEAFTLMGHAGNVRSVAFSPDGKRLASSGDLFDRTVKVWNTLTGQPTLVFRAPTGGGSGLAFSPDGKRLAATDYLDQTVKVWDTATGQAVLTLKGHAYTVFGVAFSPDGKRLAGGGGEDKTVRVWDAATGERVLTLRGHTAQIQVVAFSPDGTRLASGGGDGTVRIWDAASGQEALTLPGSFSRFNLTTGQELMSGVLSLAFSPDGKRLAVTNYPDQTVKVWDTATSQVVLTLKGHTNTVFSVAFSPDGTRLASGGGDGTVRVWDAATGEHAVTLNASAGIVSCVAFSPDGRRLACGCGYKAIKVWEAVSPTPETLVKREAAALVRSLFLSLVRKADVLDRLRHDASLADPLRHEAIAYAEHYALHAEILYEASRAVGSRRDASEDAYRQALRQAEEACRLEPEDGPYLSALGLAHYRVGQYQQALGTLTRADKINAANLNGSIPPDLAFLAMTQHQLGRKDEAKTTLGRLREAMKQPRWPNDYETLAFLRETEELIEGKAANKQHTK